ncbi:MAG: cohesin domain-containing protein [Bacteroidetes bacterium]|nr:cohesin domain-containing protein [Bacteroidota bacterium]
MVTSGPDHTFIHIIALTAPVGNSGTLYNGQDGALLYSRSADGGLNWDIENINLPGTDTNYYYALSGDDYAFAQPKGDTLAFVYGDNWTDIFLLKSPDNGQTWNKTLIFQHPYPKYRENTTLVLDTPTVCDGHLSVSLDNSGKAHVFFGLERVMNEYLDDGTASYFPYTDGLAYWNEDMPTLTSLKFSDLQSQGRIVGQQQDMDGDGVISYNYEPGKYFASLTSMPASCIDNEGDIYVVFSSVMENLNNGSQSYRHLWARESSDNGQTWSDYQNLNGSADYNYSECAFPSLSPTSDNYLHLVFQKDVEPGLALRGDLDYYTDNTIEYLKILKFNIKNDLAVTEFLAPANDFLLSDNEVVTIRIENKGSLDQSGFVVTMKMNDEAPVTETVPNTLHKGQTLDYSFIHPVDMSLPGDYHFTVYTSLTNDQVRSNDTLKTTVTCYIPPPVAVNDTVHCSIYETVTVNVLANDQDLSGSGLVLVSAQNPFNSANVVVGTSSFADSTITFTMNYKASGWNTIRYRIQQAGDPFYVVSGYVHVYVSNPVLDSVSINNLSLGFSATGLHFYNYGNPGLNHVPKSAQTNTLYSTSTWISGMDGAGQLHIAAERYRNNGQDYFAGPVSTVYDQAFLLKWNRIWKIYSTDIEYYKLHWQDSGYLPAEAIASWPGNGDTTLGQSYALAPFHDNNGNGVYEPLLGDYPLIRGDECLFFIFNDDQEQHGETNGEKLKIEVHGMAYAFDCEADSALFNTTFLHYEIFNRSANMYDSTFLGQFVDADLGAGGDDYMESDIGRNSVYAYNGSTFDGSYGYHPPVQAVTILEGPVKDADGIDNLAYDTASGSNCGSGINGMNYSDGIIDNERIGLSGCMSFNNGNSGPMVDPTTAYAYNNYLHNKWRDGVHLTYGGNGYYDNTGIDADFMLPGLSDPCNWGTQGVAPTGYTTGNGGSGPAWTETGLNLTPDDKRFVASMGPFTFHPGDVQSLDLAFVYGRNLSDTSRRAAFPVVNQRIDSLKAYFQRNLTPCGARFEPGDIIAKLPVVQYSCLSTFSFPITVEGLSDVTSFSLSFSYDPSSLTYLSYENLNPVLVAGTLDVTANDHLCTITWTGTSPFSINSGALIYLVFSTNGTSTNLSWNTQNSGACQFSDINGNTLSSLFINGQISITPCNSLKGYVKYKNNNQTPLSNITLTLKQGTSVYSITTSSSSGYFEFTDVPASGDFTVQSATTKPWSGGNATDALLTMKHFTGMALLTGLNKTVADVDVSNYINSVDALNIMRRFVGMLSVFPAGNWAFTVPQLNAPDPDTLLAVKGLCYGDVDGSYNPPVKIQPDYIITEKDEVLYDDRALLALPLQINQDETPGAVSLVVQVPSGTEITDVQQEIPGKMIWNRVGNELRIAWYCLDIIELHKGNTLFTIYAKPASSTNWKWIATSETEFADPYGQRLSPVELTLPGLVRPGATWLGNNIPNPFNENTIIPFFLQQQARAKLSLTDPLGKEVMVMTDQYLPAGIHHFNLNSGNLPAGLYNYTLEVVDNTGKTTLTKKLVIIR